MPWFQIVQPGTASYATGGFKITVPNFEKIVSAGIFMTPQTLLATTMAVGLHLAYQQNTATVKVYKKNDSSSMAWLECNGENLSGANFILTGVAE